MFCTGVEYNSDLSWFLWVVHPWTRTNVPDHSAEVVPILHVCCIICIQNNVCVWVCVYIYMHTHVCGERMGVFEVHWNRLNVSTQWPFQHKANVVHSQPHLERFLTSSFWAQHDMIHRSQHGWCLLWTPRLNHATSSEPSDCLAPVDDVHPTQALINHSATLHCFHCWPLVPFLHSPGVKEQNTESLCFFALFLQRPLYSRIASLLSEPTRIDGIWK